MSSRRDELLDIASDLFHEYGYKSVNLRLIADRAAIKKASLYYHFPDGKEEIFLDVHLRSFRRHNNKIEEIVRKNEDFRTRINTLVDWFINQPSLHLTSMMHLDMDNLTEENFQFLYDALFNEIFMPISRIFEEANNQGDIRISSPQAITGALLAIIDAMDVIPHPDEDLKMTRVKEVIDILLNGMRRRE